MTQFQIFETKEAAEAINANIDALPFCKFYGCGTGAEKYRDIYVRDDGDPRVCAIVDDDLIEACSKMTPEERLRYYDETNLHSLEYIREQGWFQFPY